MTCSEWVLGVQKPGWPAQGHLDLVLKTTLLHPGVVLVCSAQCGWAADTVSLWTQEILYGGSDVFSFTKRAIWGGWAGSFLETVTSDQGMILGLFHMR